MQFIFRIFLGRFTDAKAALKWLKSSEAEVESEFQTLKISYTSKTLNPNGGGEYSLLTRIRNLLSRKDIWKPLALMMTLMLLQQFCGLSTIAFYAVNVLTESNSNVDEVCSIHILASVTDQCTGKSNFCH